MYVQYVACISCYPPDTIRALVDSFYIGMVQSMGLYVYFVTITKFNCMNMYIPLLHQ